MGPYGVTGADDRSTAETSHQGTALAPNSRSLSPRSELYEPITADQCDDDSASRQRRARVQGTVQVCVANSTKRRP